MGFREIRDRVYRDVLLSPDFFAETVTYYPKAGGARDVVVSIEETGDILLENSDQSVVRMTELVVQVMRDELSVSTAGVSVGGIPHPLIGDQLLRHSDRDWLRNKAVNVSESRLRFTFTGETRNAYESMWRLVYHRPLLGAVGIG